MAEINDEDVQGSSVTHCLEMMLLATVDQLPHDIKDQVRQLLTPQALLMIEGVTALWFFSHIFGFGEVFDALVIATGVVALGADAVRAAKMTMEAFVSARAAKTAAEINQSANEFASAIAIVGVDMLATLLFRWKRPGDMPNLRIGDFPRAPEIEGGGWRYQPRVQRYPFPKGSRSENALGLATPYGDIHINTRYSLDVQQETFFHEVIHRRLRPKTAILRRLRAKWTQASYNNSYLTRYFEEALAETSALTKARGFSFAKLVQGMTFPFSEGYHLTLRALVQEAGETLVGPVKVENAIYQLSIGEGAVSGPGSGGGQNFGDAFDAARLAAVRR